jgi:hypothetical protein
MLDLAVALTCVACVCAPMLPIVGAAEQSPALVESGGTVDQRVIEGGIISNPLNGSFESGSRGKVDGSIQWDLYTTARDGMKLLVSSDRDPAMRDAKNGIDVPDYASTLGAWDVSGSSRAFGFTATGPLTLSRFDNGRKWRGFDGTRSIEVSRRGAPIARTRTTVRFRGEFSSALPSDARATANVVATAVPNF